MAAVRGFSERFASTTESWTRRLWTDLALTTKMILIVVAALLVLAGSFGYLGVHATRSNTQQALQERVALAQLAASHLDSVFAHIERMMVSIAALLAPEGSQSDLTGSKLLGQHAAYQQLILFSQQIFLLNNRGEIVQAEPADPMPDLIPLTSVPSIQSTLQTGRFAVSGLVSLATGQRPTALVSVPIRNGAGTIIGALAISLDLESPEMNAFLQPVSLGETGYMEVVDSNGVILLSTRPDRVLRQSDHRGSLANMIQERKPMVAVCHDCHQTPRGEAPRPEVMAFAPLTRVDWGVVVRQHQEEAFAAARQLQERVVILGVVALLLALVMVWMITRSVVAPLKLLTGAAQRIAQGDLDTPIHCGRGDEIGALAEAFDHMRTRLRDFMDEIQAWNRELDKRVRERTAALMAAQAEAQQARDYLQAIIDGLSDELVVVDRDFRVRLANAAVQKRWNGQEPVLGQRCWVVNHDGRPCQPPHCECPVREVMKSGKPVRVTHFHEQGEMEGEGRYVDIVASPLHDHRGDMSGVIELLRDVTEEMRMKQALVRRNKELSALNAIAAIVSRSLDLQEILDMALDKVLELTDVDAGAVFLREDGNDDLALAAHRGLGAAAAEALRREWIDASRTGAMETDRPVVMSQPPRPQGATEGDLDSNGLRSVVYVPLIAKGTALGIMCVGTREPRDLANEVELLRALGRQIAVGVENATLYADVRRKEQMRGELLKKIITAQEEERKRIARELHDETSQALTAIVMNCAALEQVIPKGLEDFKTKLSVVRTTAARSLRNLRTLIFDLRPEALDDLGLELAIRGHAKERLEDAGIHTRVHVVNLPDRLPSEVETTVFRLVQEGIANIVRHAQASEARIHLELVNGHLQLVVEDNGRGFDPRKTMTAEGGNGWGLRGMEERVTLLDGEMRIESSPGKGTRILVKIPLEG
ncbi:MAG: GAF domain-containing protein [Chloroflexi bacterium]|nr:GAF domain-containing protein [Chloroflexota bacterium]